MESREPQVSPVVVGTVLCLPVRDLTASLDFYRSVFGLPGLTAEEGMVTVELPGLSLFLLEEQAFASYSRKAGRAVAYPGAEEGSSVILSCAIGSREALDDMLEVAAARGGTVARRGELDPDLGLYLGYVFDPDGHHWELAHSSRA
ncbi:VOC family protein [Salana multivorans]